MTKNIMNKGILWIVVLIIIFFMFKGPDIEKETKKTAAEVVTVSNNGPILISSQVAMTFTISDNTQSNLWKVKEVVTPPGWSFFDKSFTGASGPGHNEICSMEPNGYFCTMIAQPGSTIAKTLTITYVSPVSGGQTTFTGGWETYSESTLQNDDTFSSVVTVISPSCTAGTIVADCGASTDCNLWSCPSGECVSSNVADGTSCNSGTGICQSGACQDVECTISSDCGTDTTCKSWNCQSNACVSNNAAAGTGCGTGKQCDGNGNCATAEQCTVDSDCDNLDTTCRNYFCSISSGECNYNPQNQDTSCTKGNGGPGYCSSVGDCVDCTLESQCPLDTICRNYFCGASFECTWNANVQVACTPVGGGIGQCNSQGDCTPTATCIPNCGTNVCGVDPVCATKLCGSCTSDETCSSGQCVDKPEEKDKCEIWETEEGGKCELAGWVYIAIGFMAFMVFLNVIKS